MTLEEITASRAESDEVDFKVGFDPESQRDRCELLKDIVAIGNHGGGGIVIGVADDGTTVGANQSTIDRLDPAALGDQIRKHTRRHEPACVVHVVKRDGLDVVVIAVSATAVPVVFAINGTYPLGDTQRTAFVEGKVYFRHNSKSEPGTTEDLERAIEREISRRREEWLGNIRKVVEAPLGAHVTVLTPESDPAKVSPVGVRLVDAPDAPAVPHWEPDNTHPYRQKEIVLEVNRALDGKHHVTSHDVLCIRRVYGIDNNPNFSHKSRFSSRQYSPAFVEWLVSEYQKDGQFFAKTRTRAKTQLGGATD